MTDVTNMTAVENEDMFEDELKCFSFSEKERAYICQILVAEDQTRKICGAKVKILMDGKRVKKPTSNMKRHIKKSHGILHHKIVQEQEKKKTAQKRNIKVSEITLSRNGNDSLSFGGQKKQKMLDSFFNKVTVTISKEDFKKALNMLVLQNGVSFNMFSGDGIEILTRDLAKKFGIKISRENMRQEIQTLAEKKRSDLKSELNGKFIFLKVDGASRHRRSFLGVNTQFFSNGKILIKTLAVIDIHARHKAEDIQNALENVLDKFGIQKEQILGISTDNGSNMVKMVNDFGKTIDINKIIETQPSEDHDEGGDDIAEDQIIEDAGSETEKAEFFEHLHDGYFDEISKNMSTIYLQRCGAHTLQLAVTDAMKDSEIKAILERTRKVAKACRAPIAMEFCKNTKPFKVIILYIFIHANKYVYLLYFKIKYIL